MPSKPRTDMVKFHEFSREYFWHIPSGRVTDEWDKIVATECYNLKTAREWARRSNG